MCRICSHADADQINEALRGGLLRGGTIAEIAERFGVRPRALSDHGRKCLHLPPRPVGRPCRPCLDPRLGEIDRALLCNETPDAVAERFGHRSAAIAHHALQHLRYDSGTRRKVCVVCAHPERDAIEQAMGDPDVTDLATSERFGITHGNVIAHRYRHLGKTSSTDLRLARRAARRLEAVERYVG